MYVAKREIDLYGDKNSGSEVVWPMISMGELLSPTGHADDDDNWKHVDYAPASGIVLATGWAQADALQETDLTNPLIEIDAGSFVRHCLQIEVATDGDGVLGEFPVVADNLIALAVIESNLKNKSSGSGASLRIGPYQFTASDWERFRQLGLQAGPGSPHRIENAYQQVQAAADIAFDNLRRMDQVFHQNAQPPANEKYTADFLNVFHAHLIGAEAAYACADAYKRDNGDMSMRTLLLQHFSADESRVDALIEERNRYLTIDGETARVHQFIALTEKTLDRGLARAATLIAEHASDFIPKNVSGPAPWFDIASQFEERNVNETDDAQEIISMFAATDSGITTLEHWCGAFVADCLARAAAQVPDAQIRQSIVAGSATAAKWVDWGDVSLSIKDKDVPRGAVVVMSAAKDTGTSGHVGFFHSRDGDFIFLLGGNQSDRVKVSRYRVSRVRAIRWKHFASLNPPIDTGTVSVGTEQIPSGKEDIARMILDSFAGAGFGRLQQIAALANAIRESGLNPNAHNTSGEDSVGLFQCNRAGGLGTGHSVAWLKNPQNNINLIISEAQKYASFRNAATIEDAVREFVYKVERPADKPGETKIRIGIARKLMA